MRRPLWGIVAAATLVPGIVQAAEPACMSKSEFSSLAGYALPSVIKGATARCQQTLGPQAFLPKGGQTLATGYAKRKDAVWPAAKTAFFKLTGPGKDKTVDMLAKLPDDSLREVVDVMLEGMVSQEIPLDKCGTIDEFVRLIAPLPPENTAQLLALTASLAGGKPGVPSKLQICKS